MQRRSFLQQLAWLAAGFSLAKCTPARQLTVANNPLHGAVLANGKGVKNVVVSDGYTVVRTDRKGRYAFVPHPAATALFISTPSGYAFTQQEGIARHYHLLQSADLTKDINFDLVALEKEDDDHQFIIWADTQVENADDVRKLMTTAVPDVKAVVAAAAPGALLHGITVGDIVWDRPELYADYNRAVAQTGIPFFQCLGNHDMDFVGDDETSDDTFTKTYGPTTYSFNRGQVHYVVMDNVRYLGKEQKYDGWFQPHHLHWLKKDLSFVPKNKLIVLCCHIPVHSLTKNKEALYEVLAGRDVHIMSGHTHWHENNIAGRIYEHNHGTVCGAWWTGPICGDGTPNGYSLYTVKGRDLSWRYHSIGKPADYQMKLYAVADPSTLQHTITANIWNWDPAWQTEYFVDGVSKGALTQTAGFDPLAYSTLLGADLPKLRGWAEPEKTGHLFTAVVPSSSKEVKVIATDRFGEKYELVHSLTA